MPPPLTDYEFALGDAGTILNADFGGVFPFVDVDSITGLDSAPIRSNTTEREGMDGAYNDANYLSMRTIVINGTIYHSNLDPETICDRLRQEYTINTVQPFYFQLPGKSLRFCFAQGGGVQYAIDTNRRIGLTPIQFILTCSDPYVYDFPGNFQSSTFTSFSGIGIGFNIGFNTGFGGPFPQTSVVLTNNGTHLAYPIITLKGPLVNPVIVDSLADFNMKLNVSLSAGDTLVIDCRNKSIVLNNSVSRRSSMESLNWFTVPARASDSFLLFADSGTGSYSVLLYNTYY